MLCEALADTGGGSKSQGQIPHVSATFGKINKIHFDIKNKKKFLYQLNNPEKMGNGGLKEFFIENERILCYHGDLLYEVSSNLRSRREKLKLSYIYNKN